MVARKSFQRGSFTLVKHSESFGKGRLPWCHPSFTSSQQLPISFRGHGIPLTSVLWSTGYLEVHLVKWYWILECASLRVTTSWTVTQSSLMKVMKHAGALRDDYIELSCELQTEWAKECSTVWGGIWCPFRSLKKSFYNVTLIFLQRSKYLHSNRPPTFNAL